MLVAVIRSSSFLMKQVPYNHRPNINFIIVIQHIQHTKQLPNFAAMKLQEVANTSRSDAMTT